MKRRQFVKLSALSAVALSTSGFVRFNGKNYVGDCQTTSDILGPFYRPDSPVRNNLVIENAAGEIVELIGRVMHKDCSTPYKGAKVELWHCSADEIYDNDSSEFRYRGTTYCDDDGNYQFTTQMPVPYDAGGGNYRPAHFHMLISAEGYKPLVTQLYFTGDLYLDKDESSSHASAKSRILEVTENASGRKIISYDIIMSDQLLLEPKAMKRLVGVYQLEGKDETVEFFEKDGQLWMKNEVFGRSFEYIGENTFRYPGMIGGNYQELKFKIQADGVINLSATGSYNGNKMTETAIKK